MHLTVNHSTNYHYDDNLLGLIQTTKLIPSSYNGLKIIDWEVTRNEKKGGDIFRDAEGNNVVNFKSEEKETNVYFLVKGIVETFNTDGIYKSTNDKINPLKLVSPGGRFWTPRASVAAAPPRPVAVAAGPVR